MAELQRSAPCEQLVTFSDSRQDAAVAALDLNVIMTTSSDEKFVGPFATNHCG